MSTTLVNAAVKAERLAIVHYLRTYALDLRHHATMLLSDTMQSRPEAERIEASARQLENAANAIEKGRHWR